ncbi:MAG: phosphatidate cytidylyltransferase [Holophagaceae bacterium]|nr:phosphatidate cytidylyltransferase [Holophagaceae bacterium]
MSQDSKPCFDKKNLALRLSSAGIFALLFFTLLWFGKESWAKLTYMGILAIVAFVGVREATMIGRKMGHFPSTFTGTLLAWGFIVHCYLWGLERSEAFPLWLLLAGSGAVIHFVALFSRRNLDNALASQGITWLAGLYLGIGLGFQQKLFMFNETTLSNTGARLLLALFLIVWLGDAGAYFVGKGFGKHKLAPKVSPKKSWEGAVGNIIGNIAGATIIKLFVCTDWSPVDVFAIAFLLGVVGILGDLVESTWKRSAGVKDSYFGISIPGHGGILDRVDSLVFAAPALYAYIHFIHGLN